MLRMRTNFKNWIFFSAKDETKKESPTIFQLMGGSVERTEGKGMDFCLKMTSRDNDKQMFMNFADENECLAWFKKTKKV